MTLLLCMDTETGIVTRWEGRNCTHAGAFTHDPLDGDKTRQQIEKFREHPDYNCRYRQPRSYFDALLEQWKRLNG